MVLPALQSLPQKVFPPGQVIIAEGQPLGGLYFLAEGEVEIRREGLLINQVEEPGAVFGDMSWLMETVPTATVVAAVETRVWHAADPRAFCATHPEVALQIARTLARRLDSMNRYLVSIKEQFKDRADHLGMLDELLLALMNKHPRHIPRRDAGH